MYYQNSKLLIRGDPISKMSRHATDYKIWQNMSIDFQMLNEPFIPGINTTWL